MAQEDSSQNLENFTTFDKKDGLEVYSIHSLVFDHLDWLWISGSSLELIGDEEIRRKPIIQRFNGTSFINVNFPNVENRHLNSVKLLKGPSNKLVALLGGNEFTEVYSVNPNTLVFKKILFSSEIEQRSISIFPFNQSFRVIISDGVTAELFSLDDSLIPKKLLHDPITRKNILHAPSFKNFIPFKDHYILDDTRSDLYIYESDGKLLKTITYETLGLSAKQANRKLNLKTWVEQDGNVYLKFDGIKDYFKYDSGLHTLNKSDELNKTVFQNEGSLEYFESDSNNNALEFRSLTDGTLDIHTITDGRIKNSVHLEQLVRPTIASRNLSKELFVAGFGHIKYYNFETAKIQTFLNDKSIRAIAQINDEEFLVATEFSGWYSLNINSGRLQKFNLISNQTPIIPLSSRFISQSEDFYWSNNDNGIIKVDKATLETTSYIFYPVACATAEDDFIYYGTEKNSLFQFDKKRPKSEPLFPMPDRSAQDILKINDRIYLACLEGLEVFENEKSTLHVPKSNTSDNAFLCISNTESSGLLLGSTSGSVYRFSPQEHTFTLIYQDDFNASIASILESNDGMLWFNTFKGIVSFNPNTKEKKRYDVSDGISFYEANRYSALKTNDGNFFVGTLKGLNYFNPELLGKQEENNVLEFNQVSYFDAETSKVLSSIAPQTLASLQLIKLDPEDRNLILQYGIKGNFEGENLTYRYQLNNQPWTDLGKETELRLFNLAPGKYTLKIDAISSTQAAIKPLIVEVLAKDFFYKSQEFALIMIFMVLGLIFWWYYEQTKRYKLQQKYSLRVIQTQEKERIRIAKELHDSVGQQLLLLKNSIVQNEGDVTEKSVMITKAINEVREISHNLHPFQFDKIGLELSLKNMVENFQKNSDIFYSETIDPIDAILSKEKALVVFRMIQELFTNVEKHSGASACQLKTEVTKKELIFKVKDNGKGYDLSNETSTRGLGMQTLKERAQFIGADLKIASGVNPGTVTTITIPTP